MVNLRLERVKKGMSQRELAEQCDVSRQMISFIETGVNLPSIRLAKIIASVLGFHWTEFFDSEEEAI